MSQPDAGARWYLLQQPGIYLQPNPAAYLREDFWSPGKTMSFSLIKIKYIDYFF